MECSDDGRVSRVNELLDLGVCSAFENAKSKRWLLAFPFSDFEGQRRRCSCSTARAVVVDGLKSWCGISWTLTGQDEISLTSRAGPILAEER
jgi:hypothetical protein